MKKGTLIILFLLAASFVFAQELEPKKKLTRQEKKELKQQKKEETRKEVEKLVLSKQFVLQADYVRNRMGQTIPVNNSINFVAVDSSRALFQFGAFSASGANGLGGFTVQGKVSDLEIKPHKRNGSYFVNFKLKDKGGSFDVFMHVSTSGRADARVYAYTGARMSYDGFITSFKDTDIIKGRTR